jgi:serine/threonine protein phosphatase PrpC
MANTKSLYNFSFGNATHVGQIREANEDYFGSFETKNGYVFIVCDGMGGHVGGAKASQIAVGIIRDCLQQLDYKTPYEALSQSIVAASDAILAYAVNNPELVGMGTTCVAILLVGSDVYYAHVGDSRIYLYSNKKLTRITKDHSFVQNMIDLGGMTEEQAEKHPRKNEITNALGLKNMKPPTVCTAQIQAAKGDIFLLCSDGLTGMVSNSEIETVLKNSMELQGKANLMIDLANKAGGTDNITVQIVEMTHSPYTKTKTNIPLAPKTKNWKKDNKTLIIIGAILLMIGGSAYFLRNKFFQKNKAAIIDSDSIKVDSAKTDSTKTIKVDSITQKEILDGLSDETKKSSNKDDKKEKSTTIGKNKKATIDSVTNKNNSIVKPDTTKEKPAKVSKVTEKPAASIKAVEAPKEVKKTAPKP